MDKLFAKKHPITAILAVTGVGIILAYIACEDSCRYLRGSIFGVDLKYLGLVFLGFALLLNFLKKDTLLFLLLSFGAGGEIFLFGYQAANSVYCPFCLAFGAILILMVVVNFDKTKLYQAVLSALIGLLFFLFSFTGSSRPAYAGENIITTFGSGPVTIRLYTDYFCGPCSGAEPEIEALLSDLMDKKAIGITFVDTPIHKETVLYARYFLSILNEKRSFSRALLARTVLYEAASQKINNAAALEGFIKKKGLKFKPLDATPVFRAYENLIKEDNINSTPTCVIITSKGKEILVGGKNIIEALKTVTNPGNTTTPPVAASPAP